MPQLGDSADLIQGFTPPYNHAPPALRAGRAGGESESPANDDG
jgi:hypothetical protein